MVMSNPEDSLNQILTSPQPTNLIVQHKVSIIAILEPKIKYNHASTTLVQNVMQCIGNRRHVYSKIVQRVIPPNMKPVST